MIRLRKCCFHKIYENNIGNDLHLLVEYKFNVIGSTYVHLWAAISQMKDYMKYII